MVRRIPETQHKFMDTVNAKAGAKNGIAWEATTGPQGDSRLKKEYDHFLKCGKPKSEFIFLTFSRMVAFKWVAWKTVKDNKGKCVLILRRKTDESRALLCKPFEKPVFQLEVIETKKGNHVMLETMDGKSVLRWKNLDLEQKVRDFKGQITRKLLNLGTWTQAEVLEAEYACGCRSVSLKGLPRNITLKDLASMD